MAYAPWGSSKYWLLRTRDLNEEDAPSDARADGRLRIIVNARPK